MCGIFGAINENLTSHYRLHEAFNLLSHRGQDNSKAIIWQNCFIAHKLLALSGEIEESIQPVESDRYILVFNGQIYNIKDIYDKYGFEYLDKNPDTKCLFKLINEYGIEIIKYLNGMYAIAIIDKKNELLYLCRDQSGQKNIYYYLSNNKIAFSSEIKSLLKLYMPEASISGINIALTYGYNPSNETIYQNIYKLRPGELVTYNIKNGNFLSSYNEFESINIALKNNISFALSDQISTHFKSTRKVGINLSGGVDSSVIAYELNERDINFDVFTTKFIDATDEYNEEYYIAENYAKKLGKKFNPIEFSSADYLNNLYSSYATIEEPNYNRSIPLYYHTSKYISDHFKDIKVLFSGDGGDELFYGYNHYKDKIWHDYIIKYFGIKNYNILVKLIRSNSNILNNYDEFYHKLRGLENHKLVGLYPNIENTNMLPNILFRDRLMWLANENFIRSDKIYMRNTIELRSPFASQEIRYIIDNNVQYSKNFKNYYNKYLLRQLYFNKIPDNIIKRRKKVGWASPIEQWYSDKFYSLYNDIIPNDRRIINWPEVRRKYLSKDTPPNKRFFTYLSLAIISYQNNISI